MGKKLDMVKGGVELLVAIGVSTIVGGALVLVKPKNMGVIKKIATGVGGFAISCMATDGVTDYIDDQWNKTVEQIKEAFRKKSIKEETVEIEEAN